MTIEKRKRLRELAEKATPGPWEHSPTDLWACITQSEFVLLKHEGTDRSVVLADAAFISAAREAVPALLDDVDRLESENAALRERVAVLEEVRKAAEEVSYKYSDDYSEDNLRWNELIGALVDADALDLANKENQ